MSEVRLTLELDSNEAAAVLQYHLDEIKRLGERAPDMPLHSGFLEKNTAMLRHHLDRTEVISRGIWKTLKDAIEGGSNG